MKKVFSLLALTIIMSAMLVSCTNQSKEPVPQKINISKNDILSNNSRSMLCEKHGSVTEKTNYHFLDGTPDWSWEMSYEKTEDSFNVAIKYDDYECYYVNGEIYIGDELKPPYYIREYSRLVHFREDYDKIVSDLLTTDNILKNAFISGQHAEYHNDGYIATFEITVNNDIVKEFEKWDLKLHDKMTVVYILNENKELLSTSFYYNKSENREPIVTTEYIYSEKTTYPEVVENAVNSEDKVKFTVVQNYGMQSEYKEDFLVTRGLKIQGNAEMLNGYLFSDIKNRIYWDYSKYVLNDTTVYLL